jgi:dolichyl-phosphate-mannose-protein mannosyltransferase
VSRSAATYAALLAAGVVATELLPLAGVRPRTILAAVVGALIAGAIRQRHLLADRRTARWVAGLFLASVATVGGAWIGKDPISPARILIDLEPALLGWAAFFWLPLGPLEAPPSAPASSGALANEGLVVAALGAGTLLMLAVIHLVTVRQVAIINDEVEYLVQSAWMTRPHASLAIEPGLHDFFTFQQFGRVGDRIFTQYPPGWPGLLWLLSLLSLRWWSNAILGAVCVVLTYLLGRRLHSPVAGLVAAVYLATQPWFTMVAAGYMAHPMSMACALSGGLLLLAARRDREQWAPGLTAFAGLALGVGLAVRPFTGATIGAAAVLWILIRGRASLRSAIVAGVWLAVGAAWPIAGLLAYNAWTTGSATTFGYAAVQGSLHDLGFGLRGYRVPHPDETVPYIAGRPYTPIMAVGGLFRYIATANATFVAIGLLAPLVALAVRMRLAIPWRALAAFAIVPVAYCFYFYWAMRFYTELLPFLAAGVAIVVVTLARRDRRSAIVLGTVLLAGNIVLMVPERLPRYQVDSAWNAHAYLRDRRGIFGAFDGIEALRREHPRMLVFANDTLWGRYSTPVLSRTVLYDAQGLDGAVLVVRDRGERNRVLIARYPDRWPVLMVWRGNDRAPRFTPLAPGGAERPRVP